MTDREFLTWVNSALYEAEFALLNGDAAPRRALWSDKEPVSILGALRNAYGQVEVDEAFTWLENTAGALGFCRMYDNEAWHFEFSEAYKTSGCPARPRCLPAR